MDRAKSQQKFDINEHLNKVSEIQSTATTPMGNKKRREEPFFQTINASNRPPNSIKLLEKINRN